MCLLPSENEHIESMVQELSDKRLDMFPCRSVQSTLPFFETSLPSCTAADDLSSLAHGNGTISLHSREEWLVVMEYTASESLLAR